MKFNISYVIATRNRLPFLKIIFEKFINAVEPYEEVIVVDGNSTDGTKEYLQQLYDDGKIHQFISEPDRNQAHAWNKGLLMAKGTIIKKLIDDDVHNLEAIRMCSHFMHANPEVDICISNSMEVRLGDPGKAGIESRLSYFRQWKAGKTRTFTFGDVTMLVRRSSLSFIGLYDTQFKMIDWEYSLRCTYLNAKIAYYTGYNSLSVATPGNVSSTATTKLLKYEEALGKAKYGYPGDGSDISNYSRIKIWLGKKYYRLSGKKTTSNVIVLPTDTELQKYYSDYYRQLEEQNKAVAAEFIY